MSAPAKLTQHQMIVARICQAPDKQWWLPQDFMQPGDLFVGYEASARLSEIATLYPQMVQSERAGRYMKRRIDFANGKDWWPSIPSDIQAVIKRYYKK